MSKYIHTDMQQISRKFSPCKLKFHTHQKPISTPQHSPPPFILSLWVILTTLDTSGEWNYTVIVLLWLAYFLLSTVSLRFIYVVACDRVFFFLKAAQYSIGRVHYIFFIHSPVRGYLGCFQLLWIILLWTGMYKYLFEILLSILLDMGLEVGFLDHMVLVLFEKLLCCFS